jgi:hypothetical protein
VLQTVITTGSVELVEAHAGLLVEGANNAGLRSEEFMSTVGVALPPEPARVAAGSSGSLVTLAAIALAAAAQRSGDPFHDAVVSRLMKAAANDPAVERLAVDLWGNLEGSPEEWSSAPWLRPPGLDKVLQAIIATPPADSAEVAELGTTAVWSGFREEGLALFRIVSGRPAASPDAKAHSASDLARIFGLANEAQRLLDTGGADAPDYDIPGIKVEIAEARLKRGYDAAAATVVVEAEEAAMGGDANYAQPKRDTLEALGAAGARAELLRLGAKFLARARQPSTWDRGEWFALSSEAYRRAGARGAAIDAARDGLAAPVDPMPNAARPTQPMASTDSAPAALALYRAGATAEAVRSGHLTGIDRYESASIAGERSDPQWVVDDGSWSEVEGLTLLLLLDSDQAQAAAKFHDDLNRAREQFRDASDDDWGRQLGWVASSQDYQSRKRTCI